MEMKTEMLVTGELKVTATYTVSSSVTVSSNATTKQIERAFEDASREAMTVAYRDGGKYDLAPKSPDKPEPIGKVVAPVVPARRKPSGVLGPVGLGRRQPHHESLPRPAVPANDLKTEPDPVE